MAVHTMDDLRQMQALPLSIKIRMTEQRIREWVREYGEDGVYVSFSGGKDSTVLLDIVRNRCGYTRIPAVFFDTGLEFPEIREHVKTFDNVVWLKPELTFKEVIKKYGYPFISKEISGKIYECRSAIKKGKDSYVLRQMEGTYISRNGKKNMIDIRRYKFLLDSPFALSKLCCNVMKKNPAKKYSKETGRVPIIATMAEESMLRTQHWLRLGCNSFEGGHISSKPLSFWKEQDVLRYIVEYNIPIASVYGDIVPDYGEEQCEGQMSIEDFGLVPDQRKLKTTGYQRTGCMFCGFGCHLNNDQRFVLMKTTHPKQYEYIMKPTDQGGLGYKEIIDWINEHGDLHIQY